MLTPVEQVAERHDLIPLSSTHHPTTWTPIAPLVISSMAVAGPRLAAAVDLQSRRQHLPAAQRLQRSPAVLDLAPRSISKIATAAAGATSRQMSKPARRCANPKTQRPTKTASAAPPCPTCPPKTSADKSGSPAVATYRPTASAARRAASRPACRKMLAFRSSTARRR